MSEYVYFQDNLKNKNPQMHDTFIRVKSHKIDMMKPFWKSI